MSEKARRRFSGPFTETLSACNVSLFAYNVACSLKHATMNACNVPLFACNASLSAYNAARFLKYATMNACNVPLSACNAALNAYDVT